MPCVLFPFPTILPSLSFFISIKIFLSILLFPFSYLICILYQKFFKKSNYSGIHATKYKRNTTPSAIINLIVGICVCLPNTNPSISRINKKPQAIQQKIVNVILPPTYSIFIFFFKFFR